MNTPQGWRERFDEEFATTGCNHPIGFTVAPQPTTASAVVKEFIAQELAQAEARGVERAVEYLKEVAEISQGCESVYMLEFRDFEAARHLPASEQ